MKYPQYASIDDLTLASKIVQKYPQYRQSLSKYLAPKSSDSQESAPTGNAARPSSDDSESNRASFGRIFLRDLGRRLSTPEGYASISEGAVGAAAAPFNVIDEVIRQIPGGEGVSDAVRAPFKAISQGTRTAENLIGNGLDAIGVPENVQNLGLPQSRASRIAQQISNVNQGLAQFAAPAVAGRIVSAGLRPKADIVDAKFEDISEPVPEFRSSEEAIQYGRNNPKSIKQLEARAAEADLEAKNQLASKSFHPAMLAALRAQLAREALEFAKNPKRKTPGEEIRGEEAGTEKPGPPISQEEIHRMFAKSASQ